MLHQCPSDSLTPGPGTCHDTYSAPLLVLIHVHRVLVVIGAVEVDLDIDIVLRAVDLHGAVLGGRFIELGDFGGSGVGQFIRVLVQGITVQPMR